MAKATDAVDGTVRRGPVSWAYIYMALGFALTIEGTVIDMAAHYPWNLIAYAVLGVITFWLFIFNGWFQNKLIGMKSRYEDRAR
ncbi:MAG: hypothetical protein ACRD9W_03115 [Terriglobia bacterium]